MGLNDKLENDTLYKEKNVGLEEYVNGNRYTNRKSSVKHLLEDGKDLIAIYFRQVRERCYDSWEEELEDFKILKKTEGEVLKAVITSPLVIEDVIDVGRKLRNREIKVKDVLEVNMLDEFYLLAVEKRKEEVISIIDKISEKSQELDSCLEKLAKYRIENKYIEKCKKNFSKCFKAGK